MSWWRPWARDRRSGCVEVLPLLQTFVDGELDARAARNVTDHLRDCRHCGLEVSVYRELRASLRRRTSVPPTGMARLEEFVRRLDSGSAGADGTGERGRE
jgi:anti-sigma factor RsiW